MSDDAKYIVFEQPDGLEVAVIFSHLIAHADMARNLRLGKAVGAGFLHIGGGMFESSVVAYGRSDSLNINSRNKDSDILDRMLRLGKHSQS